MGVKKMTLKKGLSLFCILILSSLLMSCSNVQEDVIVEDFDEGQERLPQFFIEDFIPLNPFAYQGGKDYYHEIQFIEEIFVLSEKTWIFKGEVAKTPSTRADLPHQFETQWLLKKGSLIQKLEETAKLESDFKSLTLLKEPLLVGSEWSETTYTFEGTRVTVRSEILEIKDDGNIHVRYTSNKGHEEERWFKVEEGVTHLTKRFQHGSTQAVLGYHQMKKIVEEESENHLSWVAVSDERIEWLDHLFETVERDRMLPVEERELSLFFSDLWHEEDEPNPFYEIPWDWTLKEYVVFSYQVEENQEILSLKLIYIDSHDEEQLIECRMEISEQMIDRVLYIP